jgi:hypothetical protein
MSLRGSFLNSVANVKAASAGPSQLNGTVVHPDIWAERAMISHTSLIGDPGYKEMVRVEARAVFAEEAAKKEAEDSFGDKCVRNLG